MAASAEYAPPKELVNVMVQSSEKLEGAASLLEMLEDKADNQRITASELAAVRMHRRDLRGEPRRGSGRGLRKTRANPGGDRPLQNLSVFSRAIIFANPNRLVNDEGPEINRASPSRTGSWQSL